jgi:alanine dehydrogenase
VVLVHDPQTGKPLALMDAEHLTAMRTGAASGVATAAARPARRGDGHDLRRGRPGHHPA